jgi:hypothetical protein
MEVLEHLGMLVVVDGAPVVRTESTAPATAPTFAENI